MAINVLDQINNLEYYIEQLKITFDSLKDGIFSCDSSWRLKFINVAAADMLGIERVKVLGQELWNVPPMSRVHQWKRNSGSLHQGT